MSKVPSRRLVRSGRHHSQRPSGSRGDERHVPKELCRIGTADATAMLPCVALQAMRANFEHLLKSATAAGVFIQASGARKLGGYGATHTLLSVARAARDRQKDCCHGHALDHPEAPRGNMPLPDHPRTLRACSHPRVGTCAHHPRRSSSTRSTLPSRSCLATAWAAYLTSGRGLPSWCASGHALGTSAPGQAVLTPSLATAMRSCLPLQPTRAAPTCRTRSLSTALPCTPSLASCAWSRR